MRKIFSIFLALVFFPICSMSYTDAQKINEDFMQKIMATIPYKANTFIWGLTNSVNSTNNMHFLNRPILNFSYYKFNYIISALMYITQQKLDLIASNAYETNFKVNIKNSDDANFADPGYAKIYLGEYCQSYNLIMNYNGKSEQVGNGLIQTSINSKNDYCQYNEKFTDFGSFVNKPSEKLYLAFEIARRKVKDYRKNFDDPYSKLPILCGIAIAKHLIAHQYINETDFWTGEFCFFSSNIRENRLKNLISLYAQYDGNKDHLKNLVNNMLYKSLEAPL